MIPVSLKLHNFMSYGEGVEPLSFNDFSVACLTGQNGHGKSALLDAITWALWGEARKAVGQKKPDEGLLRLGAGEMLVELVLDLEGERFRVIRSFRKTGRTGRSSLELNVYQPEKGEYVSVTGGSISETQRKINQFLRMDYQTFINSSFLLQGRADEFTKKNASERKKILSDILGLGKYEEMAALAREQHNAARDKLLLIEGELNGLNREAADEPEWRERLQNALQSRNSAAAELKAEEEARQALLVRSQELKVLAARSAALKAEQAQRGQEKRNLLAEIGQVSEQLHKDHDLLADQENIMAGIGRLQIVEAELLHTVDKLKQLRTLEQRALAAQARVDQERLSLQKDAAQLRSRLEQIELERKRVAAVLARREVISAGHRQLLGDQAQEEVLESERLQQETVLLEVRKTEAAIEQASARLQAEAEALNKSLIAGERRLREVALWQEKRQEMQTRLSSLAELVKQVEQVKEQGTTCALVIQRLQDELARSEERKQELLEKVTLLGLSHGANCPLCDSPLDEAKQQELRASLQAEQQQLAGRERQLQVELKRNAAERDVLRARYTELAQRTKVLPEVQRSLAEIEASLQQLSILEEDLRGKRTARDEILRTIKQGDFAGPERLRLLEQQQQLATIAYDARQHQELKLSVKRLQGYSVQMHQLQEALAQTDRLDQESSIVHGKLANQEQLLGSESYAAEARVELLQLQQAIQQIAYDTAVHHQLEQQQRKLQPYYERYRQLTVAQERVSSLEQNQYSLQRQLQAVEQQLNALVESIAGLAEQLLELPAVEQTLEMTGQRLAEARNLYELALGRQIEAQAGLDRSAAAKTKAVDLGKQSIYLARERLVYEKLVAAFGKDGIPALIIENAIPEIEELANEVLDRLSGGRAIITIEPLRDKKSGGTKETLDIRISDEMGTRDYELFSGGEAFRTDFAIRMALSKLLARRAGTRLQTLVIDEGFGTQDAEGLEHMVEAIQSVREDFEKIIVVTHLDALKDAFPVRIEVVKHPEVGSQFRVIHL